MPKSNDEIDLASGRRLYLKELRQVWTYEGLIEGLPTAERNTQRLEELLTDHRGNQRGQVHLFDGRGGRRSGAR